MNGEEELPEGWTVMPLGDVIEPGGLFDGPFGSSLKTDDYTDSGVRVIRLENLANLRFVAEKETFISEAKYRTLTKHTVGRNDILVGSFVDGAVRVCVLPELKTKAIAKADCFCVRTDTRVMNRKFTAFQLGRSATKDALVEEIHGATRPRITTKQLRRLAVSVPPLPEQHRIVEQVEALLAQVNKAKDRLDRVRVILKKFRQAVLAAACSGRLTEEWREDNSVTDVDAVLKDIGRRREQTSQTGKKRREVVTDADGLFETPDTWRWTTLAALAEIVGGLTKGQQRRPGDRLRDVPYLRVANVQRGYLDLSEMKEIKATESEIKALRLLAGDILFTEGGDRDKLGRGWVWANEVPECIHQNHIFRARLYGPEVQPRLVSWFGNTFGRDYFDDEASQTVNLASINITKLSGLPVAVAPPEEQSEIVRRVDALLGVADTIEARLATASTRAEKLPQSILSKAFKGELVPTEADLARSEGRTFETAEEMLKRVKATTAPKEAAQGLSRRPPRRSSRKQAR